ncbi:MAG: carboxypeptidase regulatory-like domain-containing protein [Acidobacteriales bacterium]|nr:MAG: carboxypeptidase regulatory-like domain-containing protein [Terriglobales bacterium]
MRAGRSTTVVVLLSLGCVCVSAPCQGERFRIRGVVLEAGSLQPISGVEVWLTSYQAEGESTPAVSRGFQTGPSGTFSFDLNRKGLYNLEARKEGYILPGPVVRGFGPVTDVLVDSANPEQEVHLLLARPAQLSGRAVDEENGEPVPNLKVRAIYAFYQDGRRVLFPTPNLAATDKEGRFHWAGLFPGQYLLELEPEAEVGERIVLSFTGAEWKKVDHGYRRNYLPAAGDVETAVPFVLDAGADLDVGALSVRKGPAYRARIHLSGEACGAGDRATAVLYQEPRGPLFVGASGAVPCNGEFMLRGLAPGSYALDLSSNPKGPEQRQLGHYTFEVAGENVDLDLALRRGVSVGGRVVTPEKTQPAGLSIELRPIGGVNFPNDYKAGVEADGKFRLTNIDVRPQRIRIEGLGKGYFIQSMEYNGRAVPDGILRLEPVAPLHFLTVTLGDKPATLLGRVTDNGRPVRTPYVLLVKWPTEPGDYYSQFIPTKGSADGRFTFAGLAPGDYRIVAVSLADGDELNEPNVLPSLLERAKKVTLAERSTLETTLEVARP